MELKVLRTRVGLTLLGAAVFDDILVILLLSLASIFATGGGGDINFVEVGDGSNVRDVAPGASTCRELGDQSRWIESVVFVDLLGAEHAGDQRFIRRGEHVTCLFRVRSTKKEGEWLGRMVIGFERGEIKIFAASIF